MDNQIRVVIVEDSENDAILILRTLRIGGYKVTYQVVDNKKDLVELLTKSNWDLVITDHLMPGFSSQDSISTAKQLAPNTPIIVVSGAAGEELAVAAMRAGAHDYVLKEWKENKLERLIPVVKSAIAEGNRIRESHARDKRLKMFERAVEHSRNIIFITDDSGNIEYANKRFTEVTGLALEQIKGKTAELFYQKSEDEYTWSDIQNQVVISKKDWTGQMWSRDKDNEVFSALVSISPILNKLDKVTNLVVVAEDFSKFQDKIDELQIKAFHDPLTKLPNRLLFEEQLEITLKSVHRTAGAKQKSGKSKDRKYAALLCIDLDKFKEVNDTLGHPEGDLLLQIVANRIKDSVRESDTVARIGGDEFCVILPDLENAAEAALVADKILQELSKAVPLTSEKRNISGSIGIAIMPNDGNHAREIKERGDNALYNAKNSGRNNFKFFNSALNVKAKDILNKITEVTGNP